jgi:hypothetical protein
MCRYEQIKGDDGHGVQDEFYDSGDDDSNEQQRQKVTLKK